MLRSLLARLSDLPTFVLLLGLSVLIRLDTLPISDVEFDESVYFLMAKSMVNDHAPYSVVWDHKPPGIYAIYYLGFTLFGVSTFSIRLLACLATALSSLVALRIYDRVRPGSGRYRFLPALLVLFAFRKLGGEGANTEVFFVPAAAASVLCLLIAVDPTTALGRRRWSLFFAGIAMGAAFWIKFNTIFELEAAMVCALVWLANDKRPGRLRRLVDDLSLVAGGFCALTLAVILPFYLSDHLARLTDAVFFSNLRHVGQRMSGNETVRFLLHVFESSVVLWSLCFVGFLSRLSSRPSVVADRNFWFVFVWLLGALVSSLAPGQPYLHYSLETAVPLSVLAALVFEAAVLVYLPKGRAALTAVAFLFVGSAGTSLVGAALNVGREVDSVVRLGSLANVDTSRAVAALIRARTRSATPSVYVVDAQPILYHLLDVEPPTKYAFPPFLLDPHFVRVTGVDARAEVDRVLAQKPEFLVRRTDPLQVGADMLAHINDVVVQHYRVEAVIHNLQVLRLMGPQHNDELPGIVSSKSK